MKNFKYSILKDFILVIRQSDGRVIVGNGRVIVGNGRVLIIGNGRVLIVGNGRVLIAGNGRVLIVGNGRDRSLHKTIFQYRNKFKNHFQ